MIGEHDHVLADSIASLSRRLGRTKGRKVSEMLFRYYPVKTGKTIIHDFDGDLSMQLDRGSYISSAIYWAGHHSGALIKFLRGFLRPEMTIVDVGANIGEVSLFAAKKLKQGRVLAFEPMPPLFAELSRNFALNRFPASQTTLYRCGLYDKTTVLPVYTKVDRPYGTKNEGLSSIYGASGERQHATISLRKFDDIAAECCLNRLDLMKIDVEGAEWMVLKGAEEALRRFHPVLVIEISAANFRRAGYTINDLLLYLRGMGYRVQDLESGKQELKPEGDVVCFASGATAGE